MVAACWNITYLFRLGFERWISARPAYDGWVLLGIVAAYLAASTLFKVPQSMWRFSGFGEVKRLTLACALAGGVSAAVVMGLGLAKIPRAVLALHPVVALMGLSLVRIAYRMLYEHARSRIAGGSGEIRRALVMGAGEAARMLIAGLHRQGWTVLGLFDDDPHKQGARIGSVPVLGPLDDLPAKAGHGTATHVIVAMPSASRVQRRHALDIAAATGLPVLTVPSAAELAKARRAWSACATSNPTTCSAASPWCWTKPASRRPCTARRCSSPAPAAASAASCAARWRASGRRGWCCSS